MRKKLIVGNWKMNGLHAQLAEMEAMARVYTPSMRQKVDLFFCPSATLLYAAAKHLIGTGIGLGGQDCHAAESGAYTGDISANQLFDAGASMVILGHSERRTLHKETSEEVAKKAQTAQKNRLMTVICVGETRDEREKGFAVNVVETQLQTSLPADTMGASSSLVIAYEPVWAIGTGLTPTLDDIAQIHAAIRQCLGARLGTSAAEEIKILYGGSVKPDNAQAILRLKDVDGALVGGASLKAQDFMPILQAAL